MIAMVGMSMVIPFLPLYIKELGISDPNDLKRWSGLVVCHTAIHQATFDHLRDGRCPNL